MSIRRLFENEHWPDLVSFWVDVPTYSLYFDDILVFSNQWMPEHGYLSDESTENGFVAQSTCIFGRLDMEYFECKADLQVDVGLTNLGRPTLTNLCERWLP